MNRIGIIIPYFGKWPLNFNLYLKSVTYNIDTVDIIFFTDLTLDNYRPLPKNIYLHQLSIKELRKLIEKKVNIKPKLENYRKLCDFKPAYGLIFEDYLQTYDFWGFGDIDLIYGDLNIIFNTNSSFVFA